MTFTPDDPLVHSTTYTVTVSTGATDTSVPPVPMAAPELWSFTTIFPMAPTVTYTYPASGALSVVQDVNITANFSADMDPSTINGSTFELSDGVGPVAGIVSYSSGTLTFVPSAILDHSTVYTATITTGAKDTTIPAYLWRPTRSGVSPP